MTSIQQHLGRVREVAEVSLPQLDELLLVEGAFDEHLLAIIQSLARIPIGDGGAEELRPLTNDPQRRFLTGKEELTLARRIEFTRRRLVWTIWVSAAPAETKERYLDALDDANEFDGAVAPAGLTLDEDDIRHRWYEYLRMRNRLIEANLTLVERISLRYRTYGIPAVDLIQHGNVGLIRAADKFDWRKSVRFRTYAEWWIRQAIERATDTDRDVIHVPRPMRQKISKAQHLNRSLGNSTPIDSARFSELMGVDRGAAARVFSIKSGIASLERSGPDDGQPMKNDLVGPDLSGRQDAEEIEHIRTRLGTMMEELPERERRVINLRYGLGGEAPRTLEEVGEILHISRERVRQLQMRAIGHLRGVGADPRVGFGS